MPVQAAPDSLPAMPPTAQAPGAAALYYEFDNLFQPNFPLPDPGVNQAVAPMQPGPSQPSTRSLAPMTQAYVQSQSAQENIQTASTFGTKTYEYTETTDASLACPPKITIQGATRTNSQSAPTPCAISTHPPSLVSHERPDAGSDPQRDLPPLPDIDIESPAHATPRAPASPHLAPTTCISALHANNIETNDPISPLSLSPPPWDLVTQRLYSWAMVWEEDSLQRSLASVSVNQEVRHF